MERLEILAAGSQGVPQSSTTQQANYWEGKNQEDGCLCLGKKPKQTGYRTYIDFLEKEVELSRVGVGGISCPEMEFFCSIGLGQGPAVRAVLVFCG